MTTSAWLAQLERDENLLAGFVASYHPGSWRFRGDRDFDEMPTEMPITAPAAEAACQTIRRAIADEPQELSVEARWAKARTEKDVGELSSLLQAAWFGVPESTSCWQIRGFREAVSLLEDPPEDDENSVS